MKHPEQEALMPLLPHDPLRKMLEQGDPALGLRPKALAVLRHLARRAGRVVSRQELLDAVWGDTRVSDAVIKVCIREIRLALRDQAKSPRFIETLPREGYRWIGKEINSQYAVVSSRSFPPIPNSQPPAPTLVGREAELALLHEWLEQVLSGRRQVVFVTGEAGIGKTTLVDTFLLQLAEDQRWAVARG